VFEAEREKFVKSEVQASMKFGELRDQAEKEAAEEAESPKTTPDSSSPRPRAGASSAIISTSTSATA
jgi:hypothetical protein